MAVRKKLDLGVIIRSSNERTEKLCADSAKLHTLVKNVVIVRKSPFPEAMKECVRVAKSRGWKRYLMMDADVVLVSNWRDIVEDSLKKLNDVYEIDFDTQDRFVKPPIQRGVYLVNAMFDDERMECLKQTEKMTKPEGSIRHIMLEKFNIKHIYVKETIGYHGYMQSRADVFNRFALRACRNHDYINRFGLFVGADRFSKEVRVAKLGWSKGVSDMKNYTQYMDARKKTKAYDIGYDELPALKINLQTFYKEIGK